MTVWSVSGWRCRLHHARQVTGRWALCFALWGTAAAPIAAGEITVVDLEDLNRRIGLDYEVSLPQQALVPLVAATPLLLFGEVHDQETAPEHFVALLQAMQHASDRRIRLGIEFVDRGDSDILLAYLEGVLTEDEFLERIMPSSLLRSPGSGEAHMRVLRFARDQEIEVVPLESRPSGARPAALRNAEIRWRLSQELAHEPDALFAVLYGVDHVLGADAVHHGLSPSPLIITTYADSVHAAFRQREARDPYPGEVLRLRPGVYLQALGGPPGVQRLLGMDFQGNDELLLEIEAVYAGARDVLPNLVTALMHDEVRWRRAAAHALQFVHDDAMGYDAEAPERSRRQAQRRWQDWLEDHGLVATPEDWRGGQR